MEPNLEIISALIQDRQRTIRDDMADSRISSARISPLRRTTGRALIVIGTRVRGSGARSAQTHAAIAQRGNSHRVVSIPR